jgi:hypothetical protein
VGDCSTCERKYVQFGQPASEGVNDALCSQLPEARVLDV